MDSTLETSICYPMKTINILILLLMVSFPSTAIGQTVFYVSRGGSDAYSGKLPSVTSDKTNGPFATLEKARDSIRALKQNGQLPKGGVTVYLRSGVYQLKNTFQLDSRDSGSEQSPIKYKSYGDEKVVLSGGKEITGFAPISDPNVLKRIEEPYRDKIVQVDLKQRGITDFGALKPRGPWLPSQPAPLELFFQDKPMQLARWPNNGWLKTAGIIAGGAGGFVYAGSRPERWSTSEDVWVHGYWMYDWADFYEKVLRIDWAPRKIFTSEPQPAYGYGVGKRYYALNILEELDSPGEWYLDRKAGILYFWPPSPIKDGGATVSLLDTVVHMQDVSYVTFQGISIGFCRGIAVRMLGGAYNQLSKCTLLNSGSAAVIITDGNNNGIDDCEVHDSGEGGVILSGGDRKTLVPANNYATNNSIHNLNRWNRTNRPAISIAGVGNRIAHNIIYGLPHSAIVLYGNEHVVEFNDIHHVCGETDDAGAIYIGRDYSQRGNSIRYNLIHDLVPNGQGPWGAQGIYLDDFTSGTKVFGNVISKATRGVEVGGGRDNIIQNNVFIDNLVAGVYVDARGLTWAKKYFDGTTNELRDKLTALNYQEPPYSLRYPELPSLYNDNPAVPKGNVIANNIALNEKWLILIGGSDKFVRSQNNYIAHDADFIGLGSGNYQLKDDSAAFATGFQRIPLEKIGREAR